MIATTATRYHVCRQTRIYFQGRLVSLQTEPLIDGCGFDDFRSALIFAIAKLIIMLNREGAFWFRAPERLDCDLVRYEFEASLNTYIKFIIEEGNP